MSRFPSLGVLVSGLPAADPAGNPPTPSALKAAAAAAVKPAATDRANDRGRVEAVSKLFDQFGTAYREILRAVQSRSLSASGIAAVIDLPLDEIKASLLVAKRIELIEELPRKNGEAVYVISDFGRRVLSMVE